MVSAVLARKLGSGFRCAESAGKPPVTAPGPERVVLSIWTSPLLLTRTRPAVERFRGSPPSACGALLPICQVRRRGLKRLDWRGSVRTLRKLAGAQGEPFLCGFYAARRSPLRPFSGECAAGDFFGSSPNPISLRNSARPRDSRDRTVPIGTFRTLAVAS